MSNKTKFVVVQEHTLGAVNPLQPDMVQILAASPLRGAVFNWQDGMIALPLDEKWFRPARIQDFEDFRVSFSGYQKDTEYYEFPNQ